MTRKDYIRIAEIVAKIPWDATRYEVALEFIAMLQSDNPRFNRCKFLKACKADYDENH